MQLYFNELLNNNAIDQLVTRKSPLDDIHYRITDRLHALLI